MRTKLIRNLKRGDQFIVNGIFTPIHREPRNAIVTVQAVQETCRGYMTRKRQWMVVGDFPWWFSCGIIGYHNDKIEIM
jgi:hypothetical protein